MSNDKIRVAYFPLKIEEGDKGLANELIIDFIKSNVFLKSEDGYTIESYPSADTIKEMVEISAGDIIISKPNLSGDTYLEIDSNMDIVLAWIKSFKTENGNSLTMSKISYLLSGYSEDDNILEELEGKVDKQGDKVLSEVNFDGYTKNILDTTQYGANAYIHPFEQQCLYKPPVSSVNGFTDDVNITIRDIEGLETVEDGANNYKHPMLPACYLEQFGVVAVNGKSGNVTITPKDVGIDKVTAYPITYVNTPIDEIEYPSYASLQGAHNIVKNLYGHNEIVHKINNQNKVQVTFITDNDILMRDNTWYVELKDKRTEGALFNYTGRAFAIDVDSSYIWTLKSNRSDEVSTNKSGSIHVGFEDMIVKVGEGVQFIDRPVELFLDNSDGKWNNKSHRVRRFNIRKMEGSTVVDNIVAIAQERNGVFSCSLPDGKYEAEMIYFDENGEYGDNRNEVQYQNDDFIVSYNDGNKIRVPIKNQHYIPPNLTNLYVTVTPMLVKINGAVQDVTDESMIYLRSSNGQYFPHTNTDGGTLYRADSLYNDAEKEIYGKVIYTDKEGHEYKEVLFTTPRNFSKNKYHTSPRIQEIEYGTKTLPIKVLLSDPITFDDMSIVLEIEDIKTGNKRTVKSIKNEIDNSKDHFDSAEINGFMLFDFGDEMINHETIYRATIYSGSIAISDNIVVAQTTFNQFDLPQVDTNYIRMKDKTLLNNRRNIAVIKPPYIKTLTNDYVRYEDVRVFIKGSDNAKKLAVVEIKKSYIDEATGKTTFTDWENITESRAVKIYPNLLWADGESTPKPLQYSIRIRGEKVKPVEVTVDNVNPHTSGKLIVHTMVAQLYVPEPEPVEPDPGDPDPKPPVDNNVFGVYVKIPDYTYDGLRAAIMVNSDGKWIVGNPITDNSTQHFFELNRRTTVDDFIIYAFNYKAKPGDILDIAMITNAGGSFEIIAETREAVIINKIGYADALNTNSSSGLQIITIGKREGNITDIKYRPDGFKGIPHATRYHDVRFVTTPPNPKIEVNIDSKWKEVSGRAFKFKLNLNNLPVRISAYGYLTEEFNVNLGGPSFTDGGLTVVRKDLQVSPKNRKIWLKVSYVWCHAPYAGVPGADQWGNSSYKYRIFDKGKWTERRNNEVFYVVGEGERLIEPVYIGTWKQCLENIVAYNVNYLTSNKPTDPGYSEDNPMVIMIPISGKNTKHSDHSIFQHSN